MSPLLLGPRAARPQSLAATTIIESLQHVGGFLI